MKFPAFLRGVSLPTLIDGVEKLVEVGIADIVKVFDEARTAIAGSKLPPGLKAVLTADTTAAQQRVAGLAGLAGTELGSLIADNVDGATTLFANLTQSVAGPKLAAQYSPAEKAAVAQGATAIIAQIKTLATQFQVGLTPATPAPQNEADLQKATAA